MRTHHLDPALLKEAVDNLSSYGLGQGRDLNWSVTRIDRPLSVVFRLIAEDSDEPTTLYYKVHRGEPSENPQVVNQLGRTRQLTEKLIRLSQEHDITVPPVLAVDPSQLSIVTLGIPGRPLERALFLSPMGPTRANLIRYYELVGKAIMLIELASSTEPVAFDADTFLGRIDRRLEHTAFDGTASAFDLRNWITNLMEAAIEEGPPVYVHGDLSPTNILVSSASVGIIDFRWATRFPVFDLAILSYRTRSLSSVYLRSRIRLNHALVDGYLNGANHPLPKQAWRLTNALMLLRALSAKRRSIRVEAEQMLRTTLVNATLEDLDPFQQSNPVRPSWWWEAAS